MDVLKSESRGERGFRVAWAGGGKTFPSSIFHVLIYSEVPRERFFVRSAKRINV